MKPDNRGSVPSGAAAAAAAAAAAGVPSTAGQHTSAYVSRRQQTSADVSI